MRRASNRFLIALACALALMGAGLDARAEIIDRIAAVVEGQVLTTSEIERLASTNIVPPIEGETQENYRRRLLGVAIDFVLQRKDAARFGLKEVLPEEVEANIERLVARGETREEMIARLARVGMTEENLRDLVRERLQVEAYIEEWFAPLIPVSLEEIESYYQSSWSQRRRDGGEPVPALAQVREQLRESLRSERLEVEVRRWTEQLRNRANIDIFAYQ